MARRFVCSVDRGSLFLFSASLLLVSLSFFPCLACFVIVCFCVFFVLVISSFLLYFLRTTCHSPRQGKEVETQSTLRSKCANNKLDQSWKISNEWRKRSLWRLFLQLSTLDEPTLRTKNVAVALCAQAKTKAGPQSNNKEIKLTNREPKKKIDNQ